MTSFHQSKTFASELCKSIACHPTAGGEEPSHPRLISVTPITLPVYGPTLSLTLKPAAASILISHLRTTYDGKAGDNPLIYFLLKELERSLTSPLLQPPTPALEPHLLDGAACAASLASVGA